MGEAWIIDAVRTPRGKGRKDVGALVQTHPQELMATTLRALAARNALDPHDVDDVIVGLVHFQSQYARVEVPGCLQIAARQSAVAPPCHFVSVASSLSMESFRFIVRLSSS